MTRTVLGIVGGSGLYDIPALQGVHQELLQADAPVIRRGVRHEPNPLLGRDDEIVDEAGPPQVPVAPSEAGLGIGFRAFGDPFRRHDLPVAPGAVV